MACGIKADNIHFLGPHRRLLQRRRATLLAVLQAGIAVDGAFVG